MFAMLFLIALSRSHGQSRRLCSWFGEGHRVICGRINCRYSSMQYSYPSLRFFSFRVDVYRHNVDGRAGVISDDDYHLSFYDDYDEDDNDNDDNNNDDDGNNYNDDDDDDAVGVVGTAATMVSSATGGMSSVLSSGMESITGTVFMTSTVLHHLITLPYYYSMWCVRA